MADAQPSNVRIGDTERESALTALGEHMSAGRLDIDEYGERSARVSAAKTRADLLSLFDDLPEPHPTFGVAQPEPPPAQPREQQPAAMVSAHHGMPVGARVMSAVVPIAWLAVVVLFVAAHMPWWIFLVPVAITVLGGSIFGDDWKQRDRIRREQHRQQRWEMRRRGRDW